MVLYTFPATICVRLVGIPCAPYRTCLFFPLRLVGGIILHDLTLVLQFSRPKPWVFSPRTAGFLDPTLGFRPDTRGSHPPLGCFSSRPSGFSTGETPSETMPSAVLCCNRHISLDSFRHALHTKENFSTVHFVCDLMAEYRHYSYDYQGVNIGQRAMNFSFVSASSTNLREAFVHNSNSCSLHSFVLRGVGFLHAKWRGQFC